MTLNGGFLNKKISTLDNISLISLVFPDMTTFFGVHNVLGPVHRLPENLFQAWTLLLSVLPHCHGRHVSPFFPVPSSDATLKFKEPQRSLALLPPFIWVQLRTRA